MVNSIWLSVLSTLSSSKIQKCVLLIPEYIWMNRERTWAEMAKGEFECTGCGNNFGIEEQLNG